MRLINVVVVVNAAAASAFSISGLTDLGRDIAISARRYLIPEDELSILASRKDGGNCPAVWTKIAGELTTMFLDKKIGQCNDDARAAIREAFHDCGTWDKTQGFTGGCDGSLILAPGEIDRPENFNLADISTKLLNLQLSHKADGVTVADLIQFAAAVAIVTCPGGPQIKTYVGRSDSSTPAPPGGLPNVHAAAVDLYKLFQNKGFDAKDLAALLGAHSTSRQFGDTSKNNTGLAQDSTPGLWDVKYYAETLNPPKGVYVFESDTNLAKDPTVGKEFKGFVGNQGKWTSAFGDA